MARKRKDEDAAAGQTEEATVEEVMAAADGAEGNAVLEEELAAARGTAEKNWDLYLRSQAELDNFRKRAQRDREDLQRFANEAILREFLPVIDNLERAVEHASGEAGGEGLLQGVQLTLSQFQKLLEKFGVKPVDAVGELFDPARHEAIGQVESSDFPRNAVAQQLQKGYMLHDRLLRPAMVLIAKPPVQEPPAGNTDETR